MEECDFELLIQAKKTAQALIHKLKALSLTLVLCESCTAGLVSSLLAEIPKASSVLWGSFVCYSKEAKVLMLGLDNNKLLTDGLVSKETASLMAIGALENSNADIAAAVTGIAGPDGDGSDVPAGTVWIATARRKDGTELREFHFDGSRNTVRLNAANAVLETIMSMLT